MGAALTLTFPGKDLSLSPPLVPAGQYCSTTVNGFEIELVYLIPQGAAVPSK